MTAAGNGGPFCFHSYENCTWYIIPDIESQAVINIIEDRVAEVNSESSVQVFPKQLKKLKKVQ